MAYNALYIFVHKSHLTFWVIFWYKKCDLYSNKYGKFVSIRQLIQNDKFWSLLLFYLFATEYSFGSHACVFCYPNFKQLVAPKHYVVEHYL